MIQQSHFCVYIQGNKITISKLYYTLMVTAALFTVAKICKQLKCPSTKKM